MNNEIICHAVVKKTKKQPIVVIIFLILLLLSLIIGLKSGSSSYHSNGGTVINRESSIFGYSYPEHDSTFIGWFGINFYTNDWGWGPGDGYNWVHDEHTNYINIFLISFFYICLFAMPFIFSKILNNEVANTSLIVRSSEISGTYYAINKTIPFKLPIDTLTSVKTSDSILDKYLRGGSTVNIWVENKPIVLHFIQNSTEIIEAISNLNAKSPKNIPIQNVADELLKYKNLLDSNVISQEDFEAKKKQLLNM